MCVPLVWVVALSPVLSLALCPFDAYLGSLREPWTDSLLASPRAVIRPCDQCRVLSPGIVQRPNFSGITLVSVYLS